MDLNSIFRKIVDYGLDHNQRDNLRLYCDQNLSQILKKLPRFILNADGCKILDCLLKGLPNITSTCRQKMKVIDIVLKTMRENSTSIKHCSDIMCRIFPELTHMAADDLVKIINDSVQTIINNTDVNMIWCDVLSKCMNALSSYDVMIKHCNTEMTFEEYKTQCIHTLCQCQWRERQYLQLTAMFTNIHLTRDHHKLVVNKICSYINDISPMLLPSLVHQLLGLCKTYDFQIVLAYLSQYFNARQYNILEPPPQDSESTVDIDDIISYNPVELNSCLSTCIYHVSQVAAQPELFRKHIKAWPKTQLLRVPFIIDLVLSMSNNESDVESVCLEAIRSTIEQREMDLLRSRESAWVRSVMPPDVNIVSVLKVLTNESANHRHLTVLGLIKLAFCLLSTSGSKPVAQACWSHGKLILVRLCKAQPETAPYILTQLWDKLAGHCTQRQYAECLQMLCKLTPVSVEPCTQLNSIMCICEQTPSEYRDAAAVLDALHPLINFSMRTRDTLVMVCRKGFYSGHSAHQCLALSGFLTVLKNLKLSRTVQPTSQSANSDQYSFNSYLTQVAVDVHATQQGNVVTSRVRNEAMGMELVSIMSRCLTMQNAAVKELLYSNIYDCVKEKPVLHEPILELFYEHLAKFFSEDSEGSPLIIEKCLHITPTTATLVEPISKFFYTIVQFLQPAEEEENLEDILQSESPETSSTHLKNKLNFIMLYVSNSEHIAIVDLKGISLTDLTAESKAKSLEVQQILSCYEALIAYRITQWSSNSNNVVNVVYKLYKNYDQLLERTKVPSKISKKRRESLNDTKSNAVSTEKGEKSQEKRKSPNKFSNMVKERAGPFKPLPCVWNLKFCVQIVEFLYCEEVPWCSAEERNQLRTKRDFHHWTLKCILSVLNNEHLEKKSVATYAVRLARVLYIRCICRFQDMWDFDDQTVLGCVDVFRACLNLLLSSNYSFKLGFFLPTIVGTVETKSAVYIATILERIYSSLKRIEEETGEGERDSIVKKLVTSFVQTATVLMEVRTQSSIEMAAIIVKFEDYVRMSKQEVISLIPPILTACCRVQQEAQLLDDLSLKLVNVMGTIKNTDSSIEDDESNMFPTIRSGNGPIVLGHICSHLTDQIRFIEHILTRIRDRGQAVLTQIVTSHHIETVNREIKEMYKSLVIQLCQVTIWTTKVANLRCSIGAGSDKVLGVCLRLYTVLATLAKHIDVATAIDVRFECLVKLSGKKLSSVITSLTMHLDTSQKQQNANKVLRDTKLVPRLVLQAELYSKHVFLLANKAKVNWQKYISLGTARDFRILTDVMSTRKRPHNPEEDIQASEAESDIIMVEEEIDEDRDDESL